MLSEALTWSGSILLAVIALGVALCVIDFSSDLH